MQSPNNPSILGNPHYPHQPRGLYAFKKQLASIEKEHHKLQKVIIIPQTYTASRKSIAVVCQNRDAQETPRNKIKLGAPCFSHKMPLFRTVQEVGGSFCSYSTPVYLQMTQNKGEKGSKHELKRTQFQPSDMQLQHLDRDNI